jgi:hypothetical protein
MLLAQQWTRAYSCLLFQPSLQQQVSTAAAAAAAAALCLWGGTLTVICSQAVARYSMLFVATALCLAGKWGMHHIVV